MKVAINARLVPGRGSGGTESVLLGLIHALGRLDGPEEYSLIVSPEAPTWLDAVRGPNQRVVVAPGGRAATTGAIAQVRQWTRARLSDVKRRLVPPRQRWPEVPISDGFIESLGCDLVHFPYQGFVLCSVPFIYNPHDLQHRHYPQFFSPYDLACRDVGYRAGCRLAQAVAVGSQWIARDIEHEFGLNRDRVQVIPWAPPTQAIPEPTQQETEAVLARHQLRGPYALYPAMLWEHKNHMRLLQAMDQLRERGSPQLRLVCTGYRHEPMWGRLRAEVERLKLDEVVRFVGSVSGSELRSIYRAAEFVVVPTLFEAASAPMFEAWYEGVPVAASTVTSLPEQAGDAALLFDPLSVDDIAGALDKMHSDPELRRTLVTRGRERLKAFSWERTARAYRALYRRVAGRPLTREDQSVLHWDWMRDSSPQELRMA